MRVSIAALDLAAGTDLQLSTTFPGLSCSSGPIAGWEGRKELAARIAQGGEL
jgi:hypothetical protein